VGAGRIANRTAYDIHAKAARPRLLAHLPGVASFGPFDSTLAILRDPRGFYEAGWRRYGAVFTSSFLGARGVQLLGPEANELVLFDRAGAFSARLGWRPYLDRLFPRGIMLMDFEEHRLHRRALSVAFKSNAMRAYFQRLDLGVAAALDGWRDVSDERLVYPAMKRMTLKLATQTFLGMKPGPEADAVNKAFVAEVAASIGWVRAPLPFTALGRGVRARAWLVEHLAGLVRQRRDGDGEDLLSELCRTRLDDGRLLTDAEIADHMNFMMMAAHDTLASSLTSFVYMLAAHPEWQARLREEAAGLGLARDEPTPFDELERLKLTEMAFKETLRMVPPLAVWPRRAIREVTFKGVVIPAGAQVAVASIHTHYMPEHWPDPDRFDPMRFTDEAERARHRFAFIPFGGGSHMCLGLHYAMMQARSFARHLTQRFEFKLTPGYQPAWNMLPIAKPKGGLPVVFRAL
jgi:cytochrome P450